MSEAKECQNRIREVLKRVKVKIEWWHAYGRGNQMNAVRKCPKCGATLTVKGGKKGKMKAVAISLLTMKIETIHICPSCGYSEKSQTTIQK
jgi:transcription elongation factor Elf1